MLFVFLKSINVYCLYYGNMFLVLFNVYLLCCMEDCIV